MEFLPLYEHFVEGEDWHSDAAKATSENGTEPTLIGSVEPQPVTTKDAMGSRPLAEGDQS